MMSNDWNNIISSVSGRCGIFWRVHEVWRDPSYVSSPFVQNAHEQLVKQVLLAKPMEKRHRGRPRTKWRDYISDLAWSHLGVEAVETYIWDCSWCEVFWVLLGLLTPRSSPEDMGRENEVCFDLIEYFDDTPTRNSSIQPCPDPKQLSAIFTFPSRFILHSFEVLAFQHKK